MTRRLRRFVGILVLASATLITVHALEEGGTCTLCPCNDLIFSANYHGNVCEPGMLFWAFCTVYGHWCTQYGT